MTTLQRVITKNEISLGGVFYRLTRPVQWNIASQFPAKIQIGDFSGESQQHTSAIRWSGATGGIGKKDHEGAVDVNRLWYGTSHLRVDGHRTLPDRVTTTAASGVSGVVKVGAMEELADQIYAAYNTSIRKYTFATDSWGSSLHTLPAIATDVITTRLGGTVYMVFAHTGGMTYTTDGSTFTDITDDALYLEEWDDRIWAIDNTGQLRWAFDPTGTWTNDAQLPLANGNAQDLLVGRRADGEHILFASTKVGLFAHDVANNAFVKTEMDLPFHDDSGAGVTRWRDATFVPAGLAAYKYSIGGAAAVIQTVGPDKDQGLPSDRRGRIIKLEKSHNDLLAFVDSTSAAATTLNTFPSAGLGTHLSPAMNADTGRALILGWNELGWQVVFESEAQTEAITASLVSNAYGSYRLWFAHNRRVKYIALPVDVVNPSEISDRVYADSSRDEFPWFDAGQAEIDKLAVRVKGEVAGTSTTETATIYYALNYDDAETAWVALDTIVTDGITTYNLPNTSPTGTSAAVGIDFRAIRFRTDLANGSDESLSPDFRSLTLEYRKKLPVRLGWNVELNLNEAYKSLTSLEMQLALQTAIGSNTLLEFTYRDDDGVTRNYYVDIIQVTGLDRTGHDERTTVRLTLVQV
jgi:hypothetical protein